MLLDIILVLVIIICFVTDLRVQKIYNKVIYPTLAVAILLHGVLYGFNGLKASLLGFVTGLCLLLIPYLMGGIGAGDVKLLALIGAIKGSLFVVNTAIYMGLIGGTIAIIIIILHKETINLIKGFFLWVGSFFYGTRYKLYLPTTVLLKKFPYGVAISVGAAICFVFKGAWIV
jgi:prepilin peptidase CpaA